jgi:hypothetical protein
MPRLLGINACAQKMQFFRRYPSNTADIGHAEDCPVRYITFNYVVLSIYQDKLSRYGNQCN